MEPTYEAFMAARDELCARIVAARTERFGRPIKGAAFHDDQTMINADLALEDAPPLVFHFIYSDAKNSLTGRGFKLLRLGQKGNEIAVGGVCFLRGAYRQFNASRIVELTDLSTGEIFNDGNAFFSSHPLLGLGDGRHKTEEEKAIKAVKDELIILTFVSACDGHIHPLEMNEIIKFAIKNWDEPLNEAVMAARIASFVPDSLAFSRALERLCQIPERARPLEKALRKVIDADRILHPNELEFADYIVTRLAGAKAN